MMKFKAFQQPPSSDARFMSHCGMMVEVNDGLDLESFSFGTEFLGKDFQQIDSATLPHHGAIRAKLEAVQQASRKLSEMMVHAVFLSHYVPPVILRKRSSYTRRIKNAADPSRVGC
jgi:hypothetical protein